MDLPLSHSDLHQHQVQGKPPLQKEADRGALLEGAGDGWEVFALGVLQRKLCFDCGAETQSHPWQEKWEAVV